jgi:two-component system CheB/CheR fusion protein
MSSFSSFLSAAHAPDAGPAGMIAARVPALFVDRHRILRRFTRAAADHFVVSEADQGRTLAEIERLIDYAGIEADMESVLRSNEPLETEVRHSRHGGRLLVRLLPCPADDGGCSGVIVTIFDLAATAGTEDRHRAMTAELNHRVKNILAVVSAMARRMARRSSGMDAFLDGFLGRLQALARVHEALALHGWSTVPLAAVADAVLTTGPGFGDRTSVAGPPLWLGPRAATTLAMVLHELATNAVRFGALSTPEGGVRIVWRKETSEVVIDWQEQGGPLPAPSPAGFGTDTMNRMVEYELAGSIAFDFTSDGLNARIRLPLDALGGAGTEGSYE